MLLFLLFGVLCYTHAQIACEPCPQLHNTITMYEMEIGASGQECPTCVPCTVCEYGYARVCTVRHDAICSKTKLYEMEDSGIALYAFVIVLVFIWHRLLQMSR